MMTGPLRFQRADVIGVRVRSDTLATTILAVEPIIVPFPPKPAPKTNAHQIGVTFIPALPSSWIIGIIAIVIGMLSTTADNPAMIQIARMLNT